MSLGDEERFRFLAPSFCRHGVGAANCLSLSSPSVSLRSHLLLLPLLTLKDRVMGSGLTARDVSVTARVGDFHSGDGEGERAAAAASEAASGATVAMPLEAWAASLPGTCTVFVSLFLFCFGKKGEL